MFDVGKETILKIEYPLCQHKKREISYSLGNKVKNVKQNLIEI
jgi:hypothetical protein